MADFVTPEQLEAIFANLRKMVDAKALGLYWQTPVEDKDLAEPPADPSKGDRYLIPTGALALELDYYEYSSDAAAQAAYPTSNATKEVVVESFETNNYARGLYGENGAGACEKLGQEFKLLSSVPSTKVQLYLCKNGNPTDNITLRIETDSGGLPSGNLVHANATKTIAAASVTEGLSWKDFIFPGSFTLHENVKYHHVLQRSGARDIDNFVEWGGNDVGGYANGEAERKDSGVWANAPGDGDRNFRIYGQATVLQCYSESSIKQQGSYSLKGFARQTDSLNEYLERTVAPVIDLTDKNTIKFQIRASRTGSNIKIGIKDSGGVWTEITPNIAVANTWQLVEWDISGVANADKDAIERIRITILNADADNIFYIDNMYVTGTGLAGDWIGHADEIATYDGSKWAFVSPKEGMLVYVKDENKFYTYIAAWQVTAII